MPPMDISDIEIEPAHVEAARMLRLLADHVEQAGHCRAFVAAVIVEGKPDCIEFGGEGDALGSIIATVLDRMDAAESLDIDALDAAIESGEFVVDGAVAP